MPETGVGATATAVRTALETYQRRLRLAALASAVLAGAVAGGLALVLLAQTRVERGTLVTLASGAEIVVTASLALVAWRRWPLDQVALVVDRTHALDNLAVTANEVVEGRIATLRPALEREIFRQASERLASYPPGSIAPLTGPMTLAGGAVASFAALLLTLPGATKPEPRSLASDSGAAVLAPGDLRVIVTPPAYARGEATAAINPASVTALEGSRVRLEMTSPAGAPLLIRGDEPVAFSATSGVYACEFPAAESMPLVVRQNPAADAQGHDRLVYLAVQPDARPVVTIRAPAKDLLFAEPTGTVAIEIAARDDLALQALDLRFTRVSGSGEGFTFKEGSLPVAIARPAAGEWTGKAAIPLATLGLEEGDTLVYHATARDQKPGAAESVSESFLIEIGKVAGIASTGFALPDDRERQALSQQMLIVKTERLEAQRGSLAAEAFDEQAKLLGIEQRMVRAEFVFMTGGEVEDEVEEATASHELTEGRLENRGQSELMTAVREMSRAEARLNAADTVHALVFERAALKALQRAFDRRRYLLRTTPERARIDLARRLTGDLTAARSSTRENRDVALDPVVTRARGAMAALAGRNASAPVDASLAARLLAVDPSSEALRAAALQLSSAATSDARTAATAAVADTLQLLLRERLNAAPRDALPADPLRGRLADELWRVPR